MRSIPLPWVTTRHEWMIRAASACIATVGRPLPGRLSRAFQHASQFSALSVSSAAKRFAGMASAPWNAKLAFCTRGGKRSVKGERNIPSYGERRVLLRDWRPRQSPAGSHRAGLSLYDKAIRPRGCTPRPALAPDDLSALGGSGRPSVRPMRRFKLRRACESKLTVNCFLFNFKWLNKG